MDGLMDGLSGKSSNDEDGASRGVYFVGAVALSSSQRNRPQGQTMRRRFGYTMEFHTANALSLSAISEGMMGSPGFCAM